MSRPDLFDEIIECLKMQALDSPDTCLSPEVRREFYADVAKPAPPPAHSRRTMSPGCAPQRFSAPPPAQVNVTKPRKTGDKKKESAKPFEEKKAMTKRTLIRKGFKDFIPETTKIIIAQRIASVEEADMIIVMENGKIENVGKHNELLEKSEIYREVYEQQTSGGGEDE